MKPKLTYIKLEMIYTFSNSRIEIVMKNAEDVTIMKHELYNTTQEEKQNANESTEKESLLKIL